MEHFFPRIQVKTKKKKGLHQKWNTFSPNSGEDQKKKKKKGRHRKWNTFFPRIQVQTCAHMHTRVKLLKGMQMKTIIKLLGGYNQIFGGIYPPIPPGFGTPGGLIQKRLKYGKNYFIWLPFHPYQPTFGRNGVSFCFFVLFLFFFVYFRFFLPKSFPKPQNIEI